jgi:O-antigen ligase
MDAFSDRKPYAFPAVIEAPRRIAPYLAHLTVAGLVFVSITAPVVTVSSALPWFRVEQLALLPIGFVYLWLLMAGIAGPVRFNALFLIGTVYSLCIVLSLLFGTFVLQHTFLYRDLYEIPKALLPVAFFTLGLEARLSETAIRRVLGFFSVAMLLVCLYAWAQWMDLGISGRLSVYYSGGEHIEGALAHYRRVYSTMGNPNLLGQLLTWAVAAFTLAALFRLGNRLYNFLLAFACLITLAMTGSRYGLLNTGLGLVLIFFLAVSVKRRRGAVLALLVVLLPIFGWITITVASSNRATLDRFQTLRNPLHTDSLRDRLDDLWRDAGNEFLQSPLFGHGPAKAIFTDVFTDSEYLDVLKEFGLLGFFAYFAYFIYPFRHLWRGLKYTRWCDPLLEIQLPATFWALRLSFIMLVTALVMNIGMSTFYNQLLQGFFWIWMGIGVSVVRTISIAEQTLHSHSLNC